MKTMARIVAKALLLYMLINLLFGLVGSAPLGRISVYNSLFPGRPRLPFGENPRQAYNFSLFDLDAMFAAHAVSAPKPAGEYRVLLIGDSSVWGTLLRPEETLAGQLDAMGLAAPGGRPLRFYNLGYPTLSMVKDLLVLDTAARFEPDLVIWLTTLEAFPREKQLAVPLVENNPLRTTALLDRAGLVLPGALPAPTFWQRTLIGRRKAIADVLRLQVYGLMWAATGIDQDYPSDYPRAQVDLDADDSFHGKIHLTAGDLALDALPVARRLLGDVPLMLVNEPVMISDGANADIRYNFYYPRGAYDDYRQILAGAAQDAAIPYLDAWNIVPQDEFTNSAIHLDARGTARLAAAVREALAANRITAGP